VFDETAGRSAKDFLELFGKFPGDHDLFIRQKRAYIFKRVQNAVAGFIKDDRVLELEQLGKAVFSGYGFIGKESFKMNLWHGLPESTSAWMNAVGPGIKVMGISFLMARLIRLYPGSRMPGVPASDTSATSLLSLSIPSKTPALVRRLC